MGGGDPNDVSALNDVFYIICLDTLSMYIYIWYPPPPQKKKKNKDLCSFWAFGEGCLANASSRFDACL